MRGLLIMLTAAALAGAASTTASPARAGHKPPQTRQVRGHAERLAARARRGDADARRVLVEEHMGLVRSIAGRYRGLGLPFEDLAQEGAIGLLRAVDEYDPDRGATFSTYAFWRVRSAITHALTARGHVVRLPRPVLERRRLLREHAGTLAAAGREPTARELAEASGIPLELVLEATTASLEVKSIEDAAELADAAAQSVDGEAVAHDRASAVSEAVERLGARKREIVSRHFGIGRPPEALARIAADLELSPSRTRSLKDAALHELGTELEPAFAGSG
ncbi:MAG TPA: sigma-70 family RNA polymerase sigma factor [Gaiellaceae bacterium]|nr:sigma-70 family RNA polymerase sigma factor [Gaiellaceae bacterium]